LEAGPRRQRSMRAQRPTGASNGGASGTSWQCRRLQRRSLNFVLHPHWSGEVRVASFFYRHHSSQISILLFCAAVLATWTPVHVRRLPTGACCFPEYRVRLSVFSLFRCRPSVHASEDRQSSASPCSRDIDRFINLIRLNCGALVNLEDLHGFEPSMGKLRAGSQHSSLRYAKRISRQAIRFVVPY
jgi:hypothetical protein